MENHHYKEIFKSIGKSTDMNFFAKIVPKDTKRTIHLSSVEAVAFHGAKALYGETTEGKREYIAHCGVGILNNDKIPDMPREVLGYPPKINSIVQGKNIKSSYVRVEVGDKDDAHHKNTLFVIARSARNVRAAFQEAGFSDADLPEIQTHLRPRDKRALERADSPTANITPPPRKDGFINRMRRAFG